MGGVGRQVGGHAVHRDPDRGQVAEDIAQICQADAQVWIVLPSPAIMALQFRAGKRFDDKSQAHVIHLVNASAQVHELGKLLTLRRLLLAL
jgi:hypothetical protein